MELELSTSPRSVWVWAPDLDQADDLRATLLAAGRGVWEVYGTGAEPRALDVSIGADALDALRSLLDAGHTLRWHPSQHPLNRTPALYGITVRDPR